MTESAVPDDRISLDVHAHIVPLREDRLAAMPGVDYAPGHLLVDGAAIGLDPASRPEALIAWMDQHGVERAWISIPPTLYRLQQDDAAARAWADYVNDGLEAVAAAYPDRLAPLYHLPLQAPAVAVAIVRQRTPPRFAMAAGSASGHVMLSDDAYAPLWAALDARAAFLFLHPCKGCDPRLDRFYLHNLLGSPTETALAAAHLAMSGIVERHTRMTICLAHAGGASAAVAGRLERGQFTGRPGANTGAQPVRQAFRHFCVDCIAHDPAALNLAAAIHGADHIYFGSDWPFGMGLPDPQGQLRDVDSALRRQILVDNGKRLLCAAADIADGKKA